MSKMMMRSGFLKRVALTGLVDSGAVGTLLEDIKTFALHSVINGEESKTPDFMFIDFDGTYCAIHSKPKFDTILPYLKQYLSISKAFKGKEAQLKSLAGKCLDAQATIALLKARAEKGFHTFILSNQRSEVIKAVLRYHFSDKQLKETLSDDHMGFQRFTLQHWVDNCVLGKDHQNCFVHEHGLDRPKKTDMLAHIQGLKVMVEDFKESEETNMNKVLGVATVALKEVDSSSRCKDDFGGLEGQMKDKLAVDDWKLSTTEISNEGDTRLTAEGFVRWCVAVEKRNQERRGEVETLKSEGRVEDRFSQLLQIHELGSLNECVPAKPSAGSESLADAGSLNYCQIIDGVISRLGEKRVIGEGHNRSINKAELRQLVSTPDTLEEELAFALMHEVLKKTEKKISDDAKSACLKLGVFLTCDIDSVVGLFKRYCFSAPKLSLEGYEGNVDSGVLSSKMVVTDQKIQWSGNHFAKAAAVILGVLTPSSR